MDLAPAQRVNVTVGFRPRRVGGVRGKITATMLGTRPKPRPLNPIFLFGDGQAPPEAGIAVEED